MFNNPIIYYIKNGAECRVLWKFQKNCPVILFRYSGYCPQYQFNYGETYAKTTHKLLLDPTINHAKTLILADRAVTDCEVNDMQCFTW